MEGSARETLELKHSTWSDVVIVAPWAHAVQVMVPFCFGIMYV